MKISILTLFPEMIKGFFDESIIKRAQEKRLVDIKLVDLRKYAIDKYGSVDDKPYGGGTGMVMRIDVIHSALSKISNFQFPISKQTSKSQVLTTKLKQKILLTSPKGKKFNQKLANDYSKLKHLIIIAGHYEGIDERVLNYVDEEISLGDFVMTGGEITASAIVDSIVRLIPGVLKKEGATVEESFQLQSINPSALQAKHSGQVDLIDAIGKDHPVIKKLLNKGVKQVKLLEYPQYTRPEDFKGKKVPQILLSGNHKEIEKWRLKKSFEETLKKRPDLFNLE